MYAKILTCKKLGASTLPLHDAPEPRADLILISSIVWLPLPPRQHPFVAVPDRCLRSCLV